VALGAKFQPVHRADNSAILVELDVKVRMEAQYSIPPPHPKSLRLVMGRLSIQYRKHLYLYLSAVIKLLMFLFVGSQILVVMMRAFTFQKEEEYTTTWQSLCL
jgi:hypothetical protein